MLENWDKRGKFIQKYFRDATSKDPFDHITFTFKENVRCFPNTGYDKE